MNAVHWHLLLNHLPVLATPFGLAVLFWGILRRSEEVKKLALAVFIVSAVIAWPVRNTGREAGMSAPDSSDATEGFIGLHEQAADVALIALGVLGVVSLAALIIGRGSRPLPGWLAFLVLLSSATSSALLAQTAYLGGQVRHTEIRTKASEAAAIKKAKEMDE